MSSVALSLSLLAAPVVLASSSPAATALLRAAPDDEHPQRRSREGVEGGPRIQMGAGPTALAMIALVIAIVGRSVRRRRAHAASLDA